MPAEAETYFVQSLMLLSVNASTEKNKGPSSTKVVADKDCSQASFEVTDPCMLHFLLLQIHGFAQNL